MTSEFKIHLANPPGLKLVSLTGNPNTQETFFYPCRKNLGSACEFSYALDGNRDNPLGVIHAGGHENIDFPYKSEGHSSDEMRDLYYGAS